MRGRHAKPRINFDNLKEEIIKFPGVDLPVSLADKLIKLQRYFGYGSRSRIIKQALREFVKYHKEKV